MYGAMKKIITSLLLSIFIIISSVYTAAAETRFFDSGLSDCKKVFSYSGSSGAYFYGFSNTTLVSARAHPQFISRNLTVDGIIRAVSHDDNYAYALYAKSKSYYAVRMNMNSGRCDYCELPKPGDILPFTFAAVDGNIYLCVYGKLYSSVVRCDFSGKKLYSYNPPRGVEQLFINGGTAYVKSNSGEIFRISGNGLTKCADLELYTSFYNAGAGYIYSQKGALISLLDGSVIYQNTKFFVRTSSGDMTSDEGISFAAYKNAGAQLLSDYRISVTTPDNNSATSQQQSQIGGANTIGSQSRVGTVNNQRTLDYYDSSTIACDEIITVSKFKKKYPQITEMTDANGNKVTSGKIKTGYFAKTTDGKFEIAVMGDLNCNGAINNADIRVIMEYFVGLINLSPIQKKAADINRDNIVNNIDLVMTGKKF